MRHKILSLLLALISLAALSYAQNPTARYDGSNLEISVPSGRLEFSYSEMGNDAVRDCFNWGGRDNCTFMASAEPYIFQLTDLATNEPITLNAIYDGKPISINVEVQQKTVKPTTEDRTIFSSPATIEYTIIGAVGIVLVLIIIALLIALIRKKKKEKTPIYKAEEVMSIIKDESVRYESGLEHLKNRLDEYIVFDMRKVFDDTAVETVYFSVALVKQLYDFFSNSLENNGRTNETGCFIIGCWDKAQGNAQRYDVSLEYMVEPGDDADFGEYSLNFGKKISINMASVIDNLAQKTKRDYLLTCWMHSHPGLGLFLSNQDLIVQRQLTYSDNPNRLIAIVIDTNTPDFKVGFFTAKTNGKMNNKEEVKQWFSFEDIYKQGREQNRSMTRKETIASVSPDNFNVILTNSSMAVASFSPHTINQIESTLYSSTKGVAGYFFGEVEGGAIVVNCCLPNENDEKIGCLVNDSDFSEKSPLLYERYLNGCGFIVNSTNDSKLSIWTKNSNGVFSLSAETSLLQMKEWIRRKRV